MHRHLPTQSSLAPLGVQTHWHYSSTVDFALFYILDGNQPLLQHCNNFANEQHELLGFSDALEGTLAHDIVDELQKSTTPGRFRAVITHRT